MVMYVLCTSHQQNTLDCDVYIIHITPTEHFRWRHYSQQQNTLDGDVYIIRITPTEQLRW